MERKRQAINLAWRLLVAVEAEPRCFHTLMPMLLGYEIAIVVLWWKQLKRKKALWHGPKPEDDASEAEINLPMGPSVTPSRY